MQINNTLTIFDRSFPDDSNAVIVETNRWKPDQCMWIVDNRILRDSDIYIIFPFPEIWRSVCHILIGESDDFSCFIHLTPLTSLFRRQTDQLEKISENILTILGDFSDWRFRTLYFPDDEREERFRTLIADILDGRVTENVCLVPDGQIGSSFNLVYHNGDIFYNTREADSLRTTDVSVEGNFNVIPIEAIE